MLKAFSAAEREEIMLCSNNRCTFVTYAVLPTSSTLHIVLPVRHRSLHHLRRLPLHRFLLEMVPLLSNLLMLKSPIFLLRLRLVSCLPDATLFSNRLERVALGLCTKLEIGSNVISWLP